MKVKLLLIATIIVVILFLPKTKHKAEASTERQGIVAEQIQKKEDKQRIVDMLELPAYSSDRSEQVIFNKAFTTSYNAKHKLPNWVAWQLTKQETYGRIGRFDFFAPDPQVKEGCPEHKDYFGSGYDRGHMCPAMDNRWDQTAMKECFYMTNICPQKHELNNGEWRILEERCFQMARRYGSLYIVCGPILNDKLNKKIGRYRKITVPDYYFKAIMRKKGDEVKCMGYVFSQDGKYRITSVDEIEELTKLDLFHNLSDYIEDKAEKVFDEKDWQ